MAAIRKIILPHIVALSLLTLAIIYPFMRGKYDVLAIPLSIFIQGAGIIGIWLSVFGTAWLLFPTKLKFFASSLLYLISFTAMLFVFFAYLIGGILFSIVVLLFCVLVVFRIKKALKEIPAKESFLSLPIYLVAIPLSVLVIQLLIAKPITEWSRDRTIANSYEYIKDIENFKSKNGYYPKTLQAMYDDYYPQTVGVEQFYYLPYGNSYNISFEQPRFLLDIIGAKEWVVYNPKDEHRTYSHTSWFLLLSPEESEISQGWYSSTNTKYKHWKSFLFD